MGLPERATAALKSAGVSGSRTPLLSTLETDPTLRQAPRGIVRLQREKGGDTRPQVRHAVVQLATQIDDLRERLHCAGLQFVSCVRLQKAESSTLARSTASADVADGAAV